MSSQPDLQRSTSEVGTAFRGIFSGISRLGGRIKATITREPEISPNTPPAAPISLEDDWALISEDAKQKAVPKPIVIAQTKANDMPRRAYSLPTTAHPKLGHSGAVIIQEMKGAKPKVKLSLPKKPIGQSVNDSARCATGPHATQCQYSLSRPKVNIVHLKRIGWDIGLHPFSRASAWKMMVEYLPPFPSSHEAVGKQKRDFYMEYKKRYHALEQEIDRQLRQTVRKDLLSFAAKIEMFCHNTLIDALEDVFFICMREHDINSCGLGITSVLLPIAYTIILDHLRDLDVATKEFASFSSDELFVIEADCFYLLHHIFECGLKELFVKSPADQVALLEKILQENDKYLYDHLKKNHVDLFAIVYSWSLTMLVQQLRKMPLLSSLWDLYIISGKEVCQVHMCICAQLLLTLSPVIRKLENAPSIQDYLIKLETIESWEFKDIERLIDGSKKLIIAQDILKADWEDFDVYVPKVYKYTLKEGEL
mmetsp:Transcript_17371/g.19353  ORF Transcript_17371/g.19353 Transcript_17371/m.19353 type:complete len:481 (+) Transcript_17371:49-1491(+)